MIEQAVNDTVPRVWPMFWGFRIMVGWLPDAGAVRHGLLDHAAPAAAGAALAAALGAVHAARARIAIELGWIVAEYGRQPWTIYGVLPTHLSVSTLSVQSLYGSLAGFLGFYTLLLVVEVYLMVKFARRARSLGTGRYQFEPSHA